MSNTEPVLRLNIETRADPALLGEKTQEVLTLSFNISYYFFGDYPRVWVLSRSAGRIGHGKSETWFTFLAATPACAGESRVI